MTRAAYELQVPRQQPLCVPAAIPGSCPTTTSSTSTASPSRPRSPRLSCVPPACGNASTAATASWTGKRSKYAWTGTPDQGRGPARPGLGTGTRGPGPGPDGQADGGNAAVRGMRHPVCPHRAGGAGRTPRRMGALARHRARQLPAAPRAGTMAPPLKGVATENGYGDPIDASQRRADRQGVPASPVLRPGPQRRALRRCRILPGLRRPVLLPALARVRGGYGYCPRGHGKSLDPHWS